ncbi:hypothetical protein FRB96_002455 [Tulasnella sp. 330]|nr:hypothetical protein FRB96_002455 [Tulasnella sp. 330]KAG8885623.1 hypothetical protein FRB97_000531 [Tulasnella sp. 331]
MWAPSLNVEALRGNGINETNALTLATSMHDMFGDFELWLEYTGKANNYNVPRLSRAPILPLRNKHIILYDHADAGYALLSLGILRVHHAPSRVFHTSSASGPIDAILREI